MNRPGNAAHQVAMFNKAFKVGDPVDYSAVVGDAPKRFTTRTEAEVLNGHTAVVWLNGKSGCVAVSHCFPPSADPTAPPLLVTYLTSENHKILLIEGHVDLVAAAEAFTREGGDYPAPCHGWMRSTDVPPGEDVDSWREECSAGDVGAEPVTLSVMAY